MASNTPVVINAAGEVGEYNVRIERPMAMPIGVTTANAMPMKYGRSDFFGNESVAILAPRPIPSKVSAVSKVDETEDTMKYYRGQ